MRVALCTLGVVVGGLVFAAGIVASNSGLVLLGLILLPLSFVLGTVGADEPEPTAVIHEADAPRTAYEDSRREAT